MALGAETRARVEREFFAAREREAEEYAKEERLAIEREQRANEMRDRIRGEAFADIFAQLSSDPRQRTNESRLRGQEEAGNYWIRMARAENLDDEARLVSEESGAPLREVYTLFFSP